GHIHLTAINQKFDIALGFAIYYLHTSMFIPFAKYNSVYYCSKRSWFCPWSIIIDQETITQTKKGQRNKSPASFSVIGFLPIINAENITWFKFSGQKPIIEFPDTFLEFVEITNP
ncbi:hypothetical protein, partial [Selenomonas ruminantium]|uniref:hypothetical protein n=1 Tax=Selenomonas ruminantium TaxID=971 RepID=UPI0026ECE1D9